MSLQLWTAQACGSIEFLVSQFSAFAALLSSKLSTTSRPWPLGCNIAHAPAPLPRPSRRVTMSNYSSAATNKYEDKHKQNANSKTSRNTIPASEAFVGYIRYLKTDQGHLYDAIPPTCQCYPPRTSSTGSQTTSYLCLH